MKRSAPFCDEVLHILFLLGGLLRVNCADILRSFVLHGFLTLLLLLQFSDGFLGIFTATSCHVTYQWKPFLLFKSLERQQVFRYLQIGWNLFLFSRVILWWLFILERIPLQHVPGCHVSHYITGDGWCAASFIVLTLEHPHSISALREDLEKINL